MIINVMQAVIIILCNRVAQGPAYPKISARLQAIFMFVHNYLLLAIIGYTNSYDVPSEICEYADSCGLACAIQI